MSGLKGKLSEIGVEVRQSEKSHVLRNKESGLYLKQQKQLKDLAELERQYQRQAKKFLNSNHPSIY